MRSKKRQRLVVYGMVGLILFIGLVSLSHLAFANSTPCEDYCFNWFWSCYSRPELLNYCTNGMMDCLINYCAWAI